MDVLPLYRELNGSHGTIRLHLHQALLDHACTIFKPKLPPKFSDVRIIAIGDNRFRFFAELASGFFQTIGKPFLTSLREGGLEIQIEKPLASPAKPTIEGYLETNPVGKHVAPLLLESINSSLGAGEVFTWSKSFFSSRLGITLHPYRLLKKYLPANIAAHVTHIQWQAVPGAFVIDLNWMHAGQNP